MTLARTLTQLKSLLIPRGSTSILEAQLKLFYLMLGATFLKAGSIYMTLTTVIKAMAVDGQSV